MIDPVKDEVVWGMELTGHQQYGRNNHEVRPMAFEANPDGSTKRMFAQATGINAVWVIDWNKRKVVDMLWPPKLPLWKQNADGIQGGDMHGVEVLPDRSAVWASSRLDSRIYGWTLPDLKYIGAVEVGPTANWMTPTPDSKFMYVAISGSDHTVAVDLKKLAIVAKIKTGARPARISTAILPPDRVNDSRPTDPAVAGSRASAGSSASMKTMTRHDRHACSSRVFLAALASAESAPPRRPRAAASPAQPRQADVDSFRKTIEPIFMTRPRRHDAGLCRLRDVPHLADQPAIRSRDAGDRRRMDAGAVAQELRDDHAAREHAKPGEQPAAGEAARAACGRPRAHRRHVLDVARPIPNTRRC